MGPTWLYFPSEGSSATDFYHPRIPSSLAGFEPANLGSNGRHATTSQLRATGTHVKQQAEL
jgi:hypothetical protein